MSAYSLVCEITLIDRNTRSANYIRFSTVCILAHSLFILNFIPNRAAWFLCSMITLHRGIFNEFS